MRQACGVWLWDGSEPSGIAVGHADPRAHSGDRSTRGALSNSPCFHGRAGEHSTGHACPRTSQRRKPNRRPTADRRPDPVLSALCAQSTYSMGACGMAMDDGDWSWRGRNDRITLYSVYRCDGGDSGKEHAVRGVPVCTVRQCAPHSCPVGPTRDGPIKVAHGIET